MKNILNRSGSFCFFILLFFASLTPCKNTDAATSIAKIIQAVHRDSIKQGDCLIQIIVATEGTYGYGIYKGKKLLIHQPAIPALPVIAGLLQNPTQKK